MKRLAIVGASEVGCLIAHHAVSDGQFDVVGFFDDVMTASKYFPDIPVLGPVAQAAADYGRGDFDALAIGIGYARMDARAAVFETFRGRIPFATLIHSRSYVDRSCTIGEGVVVLPGATVDFAVAIGDNVLIHNGCTVAHHTTIGAHSFLAPAVQMAGLVTVGERCFIGLGATVKDCLTIGERAVIGAGAVVIRNVPPATVSVGSPADVIRAV